MNQLLSSQAPPDETSICLLRTALCLTQRCTLKCKLCLAFMPYYENPQDVPLEVAKKILHNYFQITDTVHRFTVTGGEPLMHKDLLPVLKEVHKYKDQITGSVDFVTNGTLNIPEDILAFFEEHAEKTRIILSDYGELSTKIGAISAELDKRNIPYRISNFHGDNLYYDGWIDFTDHSKKIDDIAARDAQGRVCVHRAGRYFVINDGELHSCSRSYWRISRGLIPRNPKEYVPLLDDTMTVQEKRDVLRYMFSQDSSTSCAHCVGLRNDVPRHRAAEQLK